MDQPTRRELLRTMALGGLALPAGAAGKPNFVFLLTDDQRFNTLHALGNPEVQTPNMDRLVRRGVAFTHSCIMGGTVGAICMPSRAMLMTGQTLFQVHDNLIAPNAAPASAQRPNNTFPELLRKAGYDTFGTGKWHNGPALYARSFSQGGSIFFGGMSDHDKVPLHEFDPAGKYSKEKARIRPGFSSELFSNSAIRFLKERKKDNPFLAYVAYTSPHDPRMAPERFALYSPDKVKLPANFLPGHPFDNGDLRLRDEMLAPFPRTPEVIRRHIAAYYAMISEVDFQIGRVLDTLDQTGQADNTYIIFAADNGLAVGQHGLMGKQNLYDHSIRVPLVISGPGIAKGRTSDSLCYLMDVGPTILDLAGISAPSHVSGRSLRPVLRNQNAKVRDEVIFAYRHFQRGIRTDRWKLIEYNVDGKKTKQLFDLKKDPAERNDIARLPAHAPEIKTLHALLQKRMTEYGDRTQLDADTWPVFGR
ncbi:MAG: sulfatase-like hydrolase/transferase [Acidobacteriia bacterium]|nr:sulfatase-like hydrolase/transferase [Terriglobia bacterium]